jgi:hypothetical protein
LNWQDLFDGENNPILAFNAMPLSRYDVLEAPSRLKRAG